MKVRLGFILIGIFLISLMSYSEARGPDEPCSYMHPNWKVDPNTGICGPTEENLPRYPSVIYYHDTKISVKLSAREGSSSIVVLTSFKDEKGNTILQNVVSDRPIPLLELYIDNKYVEDINLNGWSNSYQVGYGTHTVFVKSKEFQTYNNYYRSSKSNTESITLVSPITIDSNGKSVYKYQGVKYSVKKFDLKQKDYYNIIKLQVLLDARGLAVDQHVTARPTIIVLKNQDGKMYESKSDECYYDIFHQPPDFVRLTGKQPVLEVILCYDVDKKYERFDILVGEGNSLGNLDFKRDLNPKQNNNQPKPDSIPNPIPNLMKKLTDITNDLKVLTPKSNPNLVDVLSINETDGQKNERLLQKSLTETTTIKSNSDGTIKFQYFVPESHCGDVRVHVLLNGKEVKKTQWMGNKQYNENIPLESGTIVYKKDIKPNTEYAIGFYPESRYGGCITKEKGYIPSWFGTVEFYP